MSASNNTKRGLSLTIVIGAILVLTCLILVAFNFGLLNPSLQSIIFSWPMLLVMLSFIGFSKRYIFVPLLLLLVGVFFLLPRIESVYPGILGGVGVNFVSKYWYILLIVAFLLFIIDMFVSKRKGNCLT